MEVVLFLSRRDLGELIVIAPEKDVLLRVFFHCLKTLESTSFHRSFICRIGNNTLILFFYFFSVIFIKLLKVAIFTDGKRAASEASEQKELYLLST